MANIYKDTNILRPRVPLSKLISWRSGDDVSTFLTALYFGDVSAGVVDVSTNINLSAYKGILKYWTGSSWNECPSTQFKYWTGSAWTISPSSNFRIWDGTYWWPIRRNGGTSILSNMVAYWKLDETVQSFLHDEVGTNDASISKAQVNSAGKLGRCLNFNASTNYVYCPSSASLTFTGNSFSFAAWFQLANTPQTLGRSIYISKAVSTQGGDGRCFSVGCVYNATNLIRFTTVDASGNFYVAEAYGKIDVAGSWVHVVAINTDASIQKLYINGVDTTGLNSGGVFNAKLAAFNSNFIIGNYTTASPLLGMDGLIDEVGIWNRAITPTEVSTLYNNGIGKTHPFS